MLLVLSQGFLHRFQLRIHTHSPDPVSTAEGQEGEQAETVVVVSSRRRGEPQKPSTHDFARPERGSEEAMALSASVAVMASGCNALPGISVPSTS